MSRTYTPPETPRNAVEQSSLPWRWRQCPGCYLTFALVDAATHCPSCHADMPLAPDAETPS